MTLEEFYEEATALCAIKNVTVEFWFQGMPYKISPPELGAEQARALKEANARIEGLEKAIKYIRHRDSRWLDDKTVKLALQGNE